MLLEFLRTYICIWCRTYCIVFGQKAPKAMKLETTRIWFIKVLNILSMDFDQDNSALVKITKTLTLIEMTKTQSLYVTFS